MEKSIRVILLLTLTLNVATGKLFDCSKFAKDLQNDEFALNEVRTTLADNPSTTFDLR